MERKRWKKPTGVILLLVSFFFLFWPGFRVWKAAELNAVLKNLYDSSREFTYSELYTSFLQGGYCKNIPVKDMAGKLTKYVDSNTVIGGAGPFSLETMELPVDITYYSAPDTDSQAVFKISMGTEIVVNPQPEGGWMTNGYGCERRNLILYISNIICDKSLSPQYFIRISHDDVIPACIRTERNTCHSFKLSQFFNQPVRFR